MAHVLITSGPTRQFIDPVRYLTNASSGYMGACLANACLTQGHKVTIVSGPVHLDYPDAATVVPVITTNEMLQAATTLFAEVDGVIGVAAPCDYSPEIVSDTKLQKTGDGLTLHLRETPDVIATLGSRKRKDQWVVGFALETDDQRFRALRKLEAKCCDLIVLNGPTAMNSSTNAIEILDASGEVLLQQHDTKQNIANAILETIQNTLIQD